MSLSISSQSLEDIRYSSPPNKGTPAFFTTSPRQKILIESFQKIFDKLTDDFSDIFSIGYSNDECFSVWRLKTYITSAIPVKLKIKPQFVYVKTFLRDPPSSFDLIYLETITDEMFQHLKKNLKMNGYLILALSPLHLETPELQKKKAVIKKETLDELKSNLIEIRVPEKDFDFFVYLEILLKMNDLEAIELEIQKENPPIYIISITHDEEKSRNIDDPRIMQE